MYNFKFTQNSLNGIGMGASHRRVVTPGTLCGGPLHQGRRRGHRNKTAVDVRHLLADGVDITNHTRQGIGASRGRHCYNLRWALGGIHLVKCRGLYVNLNGN